MSSITTTTVLRPVFDSRQKKNFEFIRVLPRSCQKVCDHKFMPVVGPTAGWKNACVKCGICSR